MYFVLYTLEKVVSYYVFSVLSMLLVGFQNEKSPVFLGMFFNRSNFSREFFRIYFKVNADKVVK